MSVVGFTALIAEDEPLLATNLQSELARCWPELVVVANVRQGEDAVAQSLALRPDVVFLDIRMPGLNGIEVAEMLGEDWVGELLPLMVFVTAYDEYALRAFEHAAIDYVLKPVLTERLAKTCERLKAALAARAASLQPLPQDLGVTLALLRSLLGRGTTSTEVSQLKMIQASVGSTIYMVPIAEVLYFDAADKYVRVVTAVREYLVRVSLRQLLPQLDPQIFWQIHRGTVVRLDAIDSALRDEVGKVQVRLRGRTEMLGVSRLYTHLFKAM